MCRKSFTVATIGLYDSPKSKDAEHAMMLRSSQREIFRISSKPLWIFNGIKTGHGYGYKLLTYAGG